MYYRKQFGVRTIFLKECASAVMILQRKRKKRFLIHKININREEYGASHVLIRELEAARI